MKKKKNNLNFSKKIRNFDILEQYRKSFNYIKDSKKFIYSVIALFILTGLIGFFLPPPSGVEERIMGFLKDLINETKGFGCMEMFRYIFVNNLFSSFIGMAAGIFLGIFPFMASLSNGYLLGFVSSMSVSEAGLGSLWRILPHGIFELPAVFISFGLGIRLGSFVFYKDIMRKFVFFSKNSLRIFVFIIIPLLLIAGLIEGLLICSGL